ncbi:MAG: DUF4922 domain-containing protein [Muribaculaceae bacterium]|nr:DUF4922 domain-containing protein [Muribaculaceae bacterium]
MGRVNSADIATLFESQLAIWDTARNNFEALSGVKVKEMKIGNSTMKVQFNPARITSSAAKVDPKSLKERKCFLCAANRPAVQEGIAWGENYTILINPFPIFPKHLTIPCNSHVDQLIKNRIGDMMELAKDLDDYTLFYNGPKCGASAPDHMHFQAGNKGFLSCESDIDKAIKKEIISNEGARLSHLGGLSHNMFLIESKTINDGETLFNKLYDTLEIPAGEPEPMLNILCWYVSDKWNILVVPRKKHRPSCYFAEGDDNILLSPASVDMGGVFITPVEKDFNKIKVSDIQTILDEVCLNREETQAIINRILK